MLKTLLMTIFGFTSIFHYLSSHSTLNVKPLGRICIRPCRNLKRQSKQERLKVLLNGFVIAVQELVDKIICRLDELAKDQARMTELIDNLKQKQMELEKGLAGVGEVVRSDDKSSAVVSNKSMALPVRQEINEALDMEKRKDMIIMRGIREDEDAEKRVEAIMQELGRKRQYQVLGKNW